MVLEIEWWNFSVEEINKVMEYICNDDIKRLYDAINNKKLLNNLKAGWFHSAFLVLIYSARQPLKARCQNFLYGSYQSSHLILYLFLNSFKSFFLPNSSI